MRESQAATGADTTSNEKILRLFGRFIGAGYFFYFFLLFTAIGELAQITALWWTVLAVLVIFGSGVALGVSSFVRDARWISSMAMINALGFLVVVLLWWLAWDGTHMSGQFSTWTSAIPGVASLAAAAAWRPVVAFAHMFVAVGLVQVGDHVLRDSPLMTDMVADLAFGWTFCAVFVAAASMAFHTGRTLDATMAETYQAAAAAAATQARSVERERFDALVHDTVLSTLLVAARPAGAAEAHVTDQARRAIEGFDELRAGDRAESDFDVAGVLAHMRSAASDVDEGVRFVSDVDPRSEDRRYPAQAARSLAAALAEAMRNSVQHAGPAARRDVRVQIAPALLSVLVSDDGVGFDPDEVSELRLGLAVSIRGRMAAQPGGSARVSSWPGGGTRIQLGWAEP